MKEKSDIRPFVYLIETLQHTIDVLRAENAIIIKKLENLKDAPVSTENANQSK